MAWFTTTSPNTPKEVRAVAYSPYQLARLLNLDPNRVRRHWRRILYSHHLDPEKYQEPTPTGRVAWRIPEKYLLELLEGMVEWSVEVEHKNMARRHRHLRRLKELSIIKGRNWGVLMVEDKRGRKAPALWKAEGTSIKAGFLVATSTRLTQLLKALR